MIEDSRHAARFVKDSLQILEISRFFSFGLISSAEWWTLVGVKRSSTPDYDSWYIAVYPRVLASVAVVCGDSTAQLEDCVMDAFVKAYERWDSVSAMDSPTGWVTRVAINRARRSFRRTARVSTVWDADLMADGRLDSYVDVELIEALKRLSFRQRRALVLHHVDGQTQAEVARDLGVAAGTASATLSQARQKLRAELAPTREEEQ